MTRIVEDNFKPAMNCASAVLDVVDHEDDIVLRKHEAVEATVVVGPSSNSFTTDGGGSFFVRSFSSVDDDERSFFRPQGNVRRWSQLLMMKNGQKTFREKHNQSISSGIQSDGFVLCDAETTEVDRLTQEIEQHDHLMGITAQSEQSRIETLRALPKPIAVKREIRARLSTLLKNKSKQTPSSPFERMQFAFGMWLNRTERSTTNTLIGIELWYGRLKRIEGHFGSAIGTYFRFLRSMFVLNGLLALICVGFLVIPQIIYNANHDKAADQPEAPFHISNLFTAHGFLANSIAFYGAYANATLSLSAHYHYSIPHAYFLTIATLYIVTFVAVSINVARSYRHSFIEKIGLNSSLNGHKLFSSWNFSISTQKAANLKHIQIYYEIREWLADIYLKKNRLGKFKMICDWTMHGTIHLLVLCVLAGFGFAQWLLLHTMYEKYAKRFPMWEAYLTIGTLGVMQLVLEWIARIENYRSARSRLHVTLIRIYCLEMILIGVQISFCVSKNASNPCWESAVGREIYRLVVADFVVFVLGGLAYHAVRWAICLWVWAPLGLPEFNVAYGSLALVFNQSLLWVGLWFAPLLALIVAVKMLITFYLKEATLKYFCRPSTKPWRSSHTSALFSALIFVSLLTILIANGYILSEIEVSSKCGPFRNHRYMINLIMDQIHDLTNQHILWRIILWFTKPAVIGGALLSMSAVTYYLRAKSQAQIGMVKILKDMIKAESRDKEYLLGHIARISNEETDNNTSKTTYHQHSTANELYK